MNTTTSANLPGRIGRWLAIAALAGVILAGFVSMARVGHVYWFFTRVHGWVITNLGLDAALAVFVAVLGTTALVFLAPTVLWYLFTGRHIKKAAVVIVSSAAIMALLAATVGRNVCFDRASGRPLCYIAETPRGAIISRTPGVDPVFGIPFVEYTSEVAVRRFNDSVSSALQSQAEPHNNSAGVGSVVAPLSPSAAESPSTPVAAPQENSGPERVDVVRPSVTSVELPVERVQPGAVTESLDPTTQLLRLVTALPTPTWTPRELWAAEVGGKRVRLVFTSADSETAARVLQRLEIMGAAGVPSPGSLSTAQYPPRSIAYPFEDLSAAQALQAALYDLVVLRLEGTGSRGTLTITLFAEY